MEGCTRGGGGGGVKGQKVQVVMGDEVLELRFNKSHRASANQPAAVGRGTTKKKKFGSTVRPPREVSGESWVTHPGWHARSRFVRACLASEHVGGVEGGRQNEWQHAFLTFQKKGHFLKLRPHRHHTGCTLDAVHARHHPHGYKHTSPPHQPAHLLPSPSHITSHP